MKHLKHLMALLLVLVVVTTCIPSVPIPVYAATGEETVRTKLDNFIKSYPSGSRWTGSFDGGIQCYGFGKKVINYIFGEKNGTPRSWLYNGTSKSMKTVGSITSFSATNVKNLVSKAKCGDVLQFDEPKQHTMVVYSVSSSGVKVYDCNWDNNCGISLRTCAFGTWASRNSKKLTLLRADNYPSDSSSNYKTGKYTITTQAGLNMRSSASTSGSVLLTIPYNKTVEVSKVSGNWGYTTYNGKTGWICLDYTRYAGEIEKKYKVDVWVSEKGKGYQYNECPALSSGIAGKYYYVWYKLYDSNGKLYNENTNYNAKVSITYPNGQELFSTKYNKSAADWIRVNPDAVGNYKIRIQVSGDITADFSKTFSVTSDLKIVFGNTSAKLSLPDNPTTSFSVYLTGTAPNGGYYTTSCDKTIANTSIKDQVLTLTAQKAGNTNFKLTVFDKFGTVITEKSCPITVENKKYTITYDANGGTGAPSAQTREYSKTVTLSKTIPEKTGYHFTTWSSGKNGSGYQFSSGASYNLNSNIKLYAQYDPNKYTVIYHANGGSGTMTNSSCTYDKEQALKTNEFKRQGYIFKGWSTSSTASSPVYSNMEKVKNLTTQNNGTVNLYAVWEKMPVTLSSITIASMPDKSVYYVGEEFDSRGLSIFANYSDGSKVKISDNFDVVYPSFNKPGNYAITVYYKNKSVVFSVSVKELSTPTPKTTVQPTAVPTATPRPTVQPTAVPTATPRPTVQPTPVPTPTPKPTVQPTQVPTPKPTVVPTAIPTYNPNVKPEPTATDIPKLTETPTPEPTCTQVPEVSDMPTLNPTGKPESALGDVNLDHFVNSNDALLVLKIASRLELTSTDYQLYLADMDHNGIVDAVDALAILMISAKLR